MPIDFPLSSAVLHTQDNLFEYELSIESEWRDVKPLAPAEKEAYEAAQAREQFKADRARKVSEIVVTISSGKSFDGHEEAQGRMGRALLALPPDNVLQWILADDTVVLITEAELKEALRMSVITQSLLWIED